MVAVKAGRVEAFLDKPDPAVRAVLVYGPDIGLVAERARRMALTVIDDLDDPFNVARLDDATLSADPGRLVDEAQSQSLMGGRRLVWVRGAGAGAAVAAGHFFDAPGGDSVIVVEAGDLKPSARLRKLFEASAIAAALPCYPDDARALDDLITTELARNGLDITPQARHLLTGILGADRQLSRGELEKLCIYAYGKATVEAEDVAAVCGDSGVATLDQIADAAAGGDLEGLERACQRAVGAGLSGTAMLLAVSRHFARLQLLHEASDGGRSAGAVKSARPPIHFSRHDAVTRQLRIWSRRDLTAALRALAAAEAASRRHGDLDTIVVTRALASLAGAAQKIRTRRN